MWFLMKIMKKLVYLLFISTSLSVFAQTTEYYAGDKRTGVDIMWFRFFKNIQNENTPFLFFSRNRASVDYHNSPTAFGSTNAISYNFKNGFGLVAVASFLNNGFTPKSGVQYYKQKGDFMFFGWLVADLKKEGNIDVFGMFRYQPKINDQWQWFGQLELFPVYNPNQEFWNITERVRIGLKHQQVAFGFMADFQQFGRDTFKTTENSGAFIRYDF